MAHASIALSSLVFPFLSAVETPDGRDQLNLFDSKRLSDFVANDIYVVPASRTLGALGEHQDVYFR